MTEKDVFEVYVEAVEAAGLNPEAGIVWETGLDAVYEAGRRATA